MSIINITLLAIAMVIIATTTIDYGSSTVGGAWAYFLIGTALLGATRLFYILADRGVLFIADDTLEFWWHLIFYLSLITFYLGARGLVRMVTMNEAWTSFSEVVAWGIFSTLFTVGVFFSAEPLDGPFVSVFSGTFLARIGIQHWIAFALLSVVGLKMVHDGWIEAETNIVAHSYRLLVIVIAAIATSIDAAVVGITLPTFRVNVVFAASVIGLVTFLASIFGSLLGRFAGEQMGRPAVVLGGIILIAIGVRIVIEHTY